MVMSAALALTVHSAIAPDIIAVIRTRMIASVKCFDRHCEPTGRREAPPDDRLREAIHLPAESKNGLRRRFAPRNDG
jgi:hypothetical protein